MSERLAEGLERLSEAAERLTRLTNELLDVAHIAEGRLTLRPEPADLAQIADAVADRHEVALQRAGCVLERRLEPASGRWDAERIDQVVTNLLSNAIKYGAGKPIEMGVASGEEKVRLWMRDNGIGIPPEDQPRLFRRFERVVSAGHYDGLGLGLRIVKRIVQAHDGEVRVESSPGKGSLFEVELPREIGAPAPIPPR